MEGMLRVIGCSHRIAQKISSTRLGPKKTGRRKLLMVCFNSEEAVTQILNRSCNLANSTFYGHIYIKRDLPRNHRPVYKKRKSHIADAARGADTPNQRSQAPANVNRSTSRNRSSINERELSDIVSESDSSFSSTETENENVNESEVTSDLDSDHDSNTTIDAQILQ